MGTLTLCSLSTHIYGLTHMRYYQYDDFIFEFMKRRFQRIPTCHIYHYRLCEHFSYAHRFTTENLVLLNGVVSKLLSSKLWWNVMGIHNHNPEWLKCPLQEDSRSFCSCFLCLKLPRMQEIKCKFQNFSAPPPDELSHLRSSPTWKTPYFHPSLEGDLAILPYTYLEPLSIMRTFSIKSCQHYGET